MGAPAPGDYWACEDGSWWRRMRALPQERDGVGELPLQKERAGSRDY
jgi:hypothetical protein